MIPCMRDWEACYRAGETPWDKGVVAPPLEELVSDHGRAMFGGGPVLVPGCGLGHDVRWLAESGVSAHGVDLSVTAVALAASLTDCKGATYEYGDFLDPVWRKGRSFPAIWEHTCFCAINPALRADYVQAAADLLDPGGLFAGVFYLIPTKSVDDDEGPPFGATVEELDLLFSPWFERISGKVPDRAYPGREGREWLALYRRLPNSPHAG